MRIDQVEIYSDVPNAAVMRHPGRQFPGVLVQGDTLTNLAGCLSIAAREAETSGLSEDAIGAIEYAHELLSGLSAHYAAVLKQHDMEHPIPSMSTNSNTSG